MIPCPRTTPRASPSPLWSLDSPFRGRKCEGMGIRPGSCNLDTATLKNIIHTFPRRSFLGNTDTVGNLGSGTNEEVQHSTALWLHCGCVGAYGRLWGGEDVVPTSPMRIKTTRYTAITLDYWRNGFCFVSCQSAWRLYDLTSSIRGLGWVEFWGEECGLGWLKEKEMWRIEGSDMIKRMAVKGKSGQGK